MKIPQKIINMKSQGGFTIVELLIVIVVIAILAAISVTAYSGIQNRAQMSAYQHTIKQWQQVLQLYSLNSTATPVQAYTNVTGISSSSMCLGYPEDYPRDTAKNYQAEYCYGGISSSLPRASRAFAEHLASVSGVSLPSLNNGFYGRNMRGLVLTSDNQFMYWVPGNKCFESDVSISPFDGGVHCQRALSG